MGKRSRRLRAALGALNGALLLATLWAGWLTWRGPGMGGPAFDLDRYDAARFALADAPPPRDRGLEAVAAQLDRPLPAPEPAPPMPVPVVETPQGPRPALRLVAVLDDPSEGRRAAIVALADGRQRMLVPDGYLEPEGQAGRWRVRRVLVEELAGEARGVLTLEEGTRVEHYDSPLHSAGF